MAHLAICLSIQMQLMAEEHEIGELIDSHPFDGSPIPFMFEERTKGIAG